MKDLVWIKWTDSHSPSESKWRPIDEIKNENEKMILISVGYLVAENKDVLTVVPHIHSEEMKNIVDNGKGDMVIPKVSIIERKILKEPKTSKKKGR
jgi:hypothetical protein